MKKAFIHQIIIEKEGFYVFERGVGYYHSFNNLIQVQLKPKIHDITFYTLCIWFFLIALALYVVFNFSLLVCLLLFSCFVYYIYYYYRNRYFFIIHEIDTRFYYEIKAISDPLELKIHEIKNRISKERFFKDIERTSKEVKLQHN